jgi:phage repressor protein C with HTH and peptisase S24 domain
MLTHQDVWKGIDRLAAARGMSPSGLAKSAGLDPTTFNKSKRSTKEGKPRWPSTESLSKILEATSTTLDEFVALIRDGDAGRGRPRQRLPCLPLEIAARPGAFDAAGFPNGKDWDEVEFPGIDDARAYALEVHGDAFLPVYRDGDMVVVAPSASIRRQDRIIVMRSDGVLRLATLLRRTAQRIVLMPFESGAAEVVLGVREVRWMARIVWASQ